jgi:hypothetical protein
MTETDKPRKYFKKAGGTVKMAKGRFGFISF